MEEALGVATKRQIAPDLSRKKHKRNVKKRNKKKNVPGEIQSALARRDNRLRVEKYADYEFVTSSIPASTSGNIQQLTVIQQGVAQSQRIADTVFLNRMDLRMSVIWGDSTNIARFTIIKYLIDTSITPPSMGEIYDQFTMAPYCPFSFENRKYYRVLYDKTWSLTGPLATSTTLSSKSCFVDVSSLGLGSSRIDFDAGAPSGTGHIFGLWSSDSSIAPYPTFTGIFRFWYFDA